MLMTLRMLPSPGAMTADDVSPLQTLAVASAAGTTSAGNCSFWWLQSIFCGNVYFQKQLSSGAFQLSQQCVGTEALGKATPGAQGGSVQGKSPTLFSKK